MAPYLTDSIQSISILVLKQKAFLVNGIKERKLHVQSQIFRLQKETHEHLDYWPMKIQVLLDYPNYRTKFK
jgi:hypothetical protein